MISDLIIAIGNVARGDDGVAHRVAALLEASSLPDDVRIVTAVGLDVAMATDVASTARLIVVDAIRRESPLVDVVPILPDTSTHSAHSIDAPSLLSVTQALYGAAPPALLLGVAAPEMGQGEGLSAIAEDAALHAAAALLELLEGV